MNKKIRAITFYLPQFHPIPENDEWWGKGFTEWTNVTKSRPLFRGHYQPHLPADLGFYDLRLPEVREQQAAMAKEYGIYGFCYYHYWFNGKRILEKPFQEVLESGKPDFPFMLCWANENWTRAWDGGEKHVLLEQKYYREDALLHIQTLIPYFKDPRYIRINNKPVMAIYRSTIIPNIEEMLAIWRAEAAKHKLELYLCRVESHGKSGEEYLNHGFDAAIEFAPFSGMKTNARIPSLKNINSRWIASLAKVIINKIWRTVFHTEIFLHYDLIFRYDDIVTNSIKKLDSGNYKLFPCCSPGWDNTSRRKKGRTIVVNNTPNMFGKWFEYQIKYVNETFEENERLVFINAWNEWAEGNHLEPCQKWGKQYLEKIKKIIDEQ
jgi:lipopolysaccharide biosynthesis protein